MSKRISKTFRAKRPGRVAEHEILPEYDLRGSKPNAYAARLKRSVIAVTLDPDVAAAFPDSLSVNRALRTLLEGKVKGRRPRTVRKAR